LTFTKGGIIDFSTKIRKQHICNPQKNGEISGPQFQIKYTILLTNFLFRNTELSIQNFKKMDAIITNAQKHEPKFFPRVVNTTDIQFTKAEITLLRKCLSNTTYTINHAL
jgi:hypothetical protein